MKLSVEDLCASSANRPSHTATLSGYEPPPYCCEQPTCLVQRLANDSAIRISSTSRIDSKPDTAKPPPTTATQHAVPSRLSLLCPPGNDPTVSTKTSLDLNPTGRCQQRSDYQTDIRRGYCWLQWFMSWCQDRWAEHGDAAGIAG